MPSPGANLTVGSTFAGRYRITHELGRGGMGVVYKAEDVRLKRAVALKFLPWWLTSDETARERFVHEAQAASALDHTNICTIYEIDEASGGQMFMAMAFCEGETLKRKIACGPLDVAQALDIAIQACEGLTSAHDTGLIHRDIKPANIMVNQRGRVKIVDFGLAKLAGQTRLTQAGTALGTVAYMSPEQARGDEVDARTDIWSLGVVLYEMLTGRVPFGGENEQAVIYSIVNQVPDPPAMHNGKVPAALERVVLKCLRKNPAERFASANELGAELLDIRGGYPSSSAGRTIGQVKPPVAGGRALKKGRILLYASALVCALVALSLLPPNGPIIDTERIAQWVGLKGLPHGRYVALLPLSVGGVDQEIKALADGLIETQTRKMVWVDGFTDSLWVVPAYDVMSTRVAAPREARQALGVNLAITGSMELAGDVLNLALDLVDTRTGSRLKHRELRDPLANLSTWQDSVTVVMARMLGVPLDAARRSSLGIGCTTVPSAFRSYLVGRGYLHPFGGEWNSDAASAWAGRAVADDSCFAMAYSALGEVYLWKMVATKDTALASEATGCCDRAIGLDHRLAIPYAILGHVNAERGSIQQAIADLERAVAIDSNYAEAYIKLATIYSKMDRTDDAVAAMKQAIRARPKSYNSYNSLGQIYLARGEYEKAIKPFRAMIDLLPGNSKGYNNLGAAYFALERWPEAEEMFKRSIEIAPQYSAYSNLGTIRFYRGRFADAASMYKKALDMSATDYKIWGHYAESCYWAPGQKETALAVLQTAVSLAEKQLENDPDNVIVLADLASYFAMMGERTEALACVERVVATDPDNADVMVRIAETYEGLGEREQALGWIGKALERGCPPARVDRSPGLRAVRSDPGFERIRQRGPS